MKQLLFSICLCLFMSVYAHDTNKAFFVVTQQDNEIVVEAEFPWTIRKAVFKEFPTLENTKNQQTIDKAFFDYINKYFQIFSSAGKQLRLKSVNYFKKVGGHSHQNDYTLVFEGNDFSEIKNMLMFNAFEHQKNYHELTLNGETLTFITDKNRVSFTKKSTPVKKNWWGLGITVVSCSALLLIYKKLKNEN